MSDQRIPIGVAGENIQPGDALTLHINLNGDCVVFRAQPEDVEDPFISKRFERVD